MTSFLSIGVKKINLSHFGRNWDLSESRDILREGGVLREEYPYDQICFYNISELNFAKN